MSGTGRSTVEYRYTRLCMQLPPGTFARLSLPIAPYHRSSSSLVERFGCFGTVKHNQPFAFSSWFFTEDYHTSLIFFSKCPTSFRLKLLSQPGGLLKASPKSLGIRTRSLHCKLCSMQYSISRRERLYLITLAHY